MTTIEPEPVTITTLDDPETPDTPATIRPSSAKKSKTTKKTKAPTKPKAPVKSPKKPAIRKAPQEPAQRWQTTFEQAIVAHVLSALLEDTLREEHVTSLANFRTAFCKRYNTLVNAATFKSWLEFANLLSLFSRTSNRIRVPGYSGTADTDRFAPGTHALHSPPVMPFPQRLPPWLPQPPAMKYPVQPNPYQQPYDPSQQFDPYPPGSFTGGHGQMPAYPPQHTATAFQPPYPQQYEVRREPGEGIPPHHQSYDMSSAPDPLHLRAPIPMGPSTGGPPVSFDGVGEDGRPRTTLRI